MTPVPFYLTRSGVRFFEHTMPELVSQLAQLNTNLERLARAAETTDPNTHGESDDDKHHDDPGTRKEEHQP